MVKILNCEQNTVNYYGRLDTNLKTRAREINIRNSLGLNLVENKTMVENKPETT